jgi:hypothetical protein
VLTQQSTELELRPPVSTGGRPIPVCHLSARVTGSYMHAQVDHSINKGQMLAYITLNCSDSNVNRLIKRELESPATNLMLYIS